MRLVFLCIFSSQRYVICACGANSGNCPKILPRQRGVLHRVSDKRLGSAKIPAVAVAKEVVFNVPAKVEGSISTRCTRKYKCSVTVSKLRTTGFPSKTSRFLRYSLL